jgi:hypothetical protein
LKIMPRTNFQGDTAPTTPQLDTGSNQQLSRVRLERQVKEIHGLGAYPLFHLLTQIINGAPPPPRIERYARLSRERGQFIRAHGGDQFPDRLFVVDGDSK